MKKEIILQIINEYKELYSYAEKFSKFLSTLSNKYDNYRGVENIIFDGNEVVVTVDDTCRGCWSTHSFSFPMEWLSMTEDEVKNQIEILNRVEENRKIEDLEKKKQKEEIHEYNKYLLLKSKFEN